MYRVHIKDKMSAVLFLVDLAGSERLKISEAKGVRKTETQHINKSLSALGDVCAALDSTSSSKRSTSHIPYRNSKLTLLLKDALGGNTTTCIIATVSPENACSHETLCTLSFAQRCRNIDLKAVTANVRCIDDLLHRSFNILEYQHHARTQVRQRDANTYLKQDLKRIKSQLSKAIEEREEFRDRMKRHEKRYRESRDALKSARRDLDLDKQELNSLRSEVKTLRGVVSDLKQDAKRAKILIEKISPRRTCGLRMDSLERNSNIHSTNAGTESKRPTRSRSDSTGSIHSNGSTRSNVKSSSKTPAGPLRVSRLKAPSSSSKVSRVSRVSRVKTPSSRLMRTPASRLKAPSTTPATRSKLKTPSTRSRLKTPSTRSRLKTPSTNSRIPKASKPRWQ